MLDYPHIRRASETPYGRTIKLLIGREGQKGNLVTAIGTGASLRVDFAVQHPSDGTPAKASIKVYNPPQLMISDVLLGEGAIVDLSAGYETLSSIFSGKTVRMESSVKLEGADVCLHVAAISGGARYREAFATVGRSLDADPLTIASEICAQAGWTLGPSEFGSVSPYSRGYYFAGDAARALKDLARACGCVVVFDGDMVRFLRLTIPSGSSKLVTKFSLRNGNLLELPERLKEGTRFKGMLIGSLRQGDEVLIESFDYALGKETTQRIRLIEVTYTGSNYGAEFYVEGLGHPVSQE